MNRTSFLTIFLRQLRFWTFHCIVNAAPSFCIAVMFLKLGKSPVAISAMLAGIGTFIVLYAATTSFSGPLANQMSAYLTTLLEGLLLSILLLTISFFAWIVLQWKDRRRMMDGVADA